MAPEDEGTEGKEEAEVKSGGRNKKLVIIILVILLLVGGGAGAFFAFSGSSGGEEGEDEFVEDEGDDDEELPGAVFPLEVFIVNLGIKGSFLKTAIQLEFYEPELPPTIEADVPKVRDAIIQILSSKSSAEILTVEGKEGLRQEVITAVNEALGAEDVAQVYFTEFIIQ